MFTAEYVQASAYDAPETLDIDQGAEVSGGILNIRDQHFLTAVEIVACKARYLVRNLHKPRLGLPFGPRATDNRF
jgi:hypothetical protein